MFDGDEREKGSCDVGRRGRVCTSLLVGDVTQFFLSAMLHHNIAGFDPAKSFKVTPCR